MMLPVPELLRVGATSSHQITQILAQPRRL